MRDGSRSEPLSYIGGLAAVVLLLYLSSFYSYLLFHSLIEITTIAVAFTLFILTWNTRESQEDLEEKVKVRTLARRPDLGRRRPGPGCRLLLCTAPELTRSDPRWQHGFGFCTWRMIRRTPS